MHTTDPAFGAELRRLRHASGLSLRDAAERSNLSYTRLSEWERGVDSHTGKAVHPPFEAVRRLARLYGVAPEGLLRLAGYGPEPDLPADERRLLAAFRRLGDTRRTQLLADVEAEAEGQAD